MPKLETLRLGDSPCDRIIGGVATKGLLALANHCPELSSLRLHLQVASLSKPLWIPGMFPNARPTASSTNCVLRKLIVGGTPVPEGSAMIIALTLLHVFPRLSFIDFIDEGWEEVEGAINRSR